MRKIFFLFLGLFSLTALKLSAQVRIGGMEDPHPAALLDLNASNATNNGNRGLALPRLNLTSTTAQLNGRTPLDGMLVYNTNKTFGEGIYYCSSGKWVKVSNSAFIEGDSIVGNEVTGATSGRGLERAGKGTAEEPYTLGIADGGVQNTMIAPQAVTGDKMHAMGASKNDLLYYNGSNWAPATIDMLLQKAGSGPGSTPASGVKSYQFIPRSIDVGTDFQIPFDHEVDPQKAIFVLDGYCKTTTMNIPLRIMQIENKYVKVKGTKGSVVASLQILEFY
jgi:hypothetical protein